MYAAADHDPADWRDLGLPVHITVAYVEAGFSFEEVVQRAATGNHPDQATFDFMRAMNRAKIEAAIKDFKAALREDSEIADLDEDWQPARPPGHSLVCPASPSRCPAGRSPDESHTHRERAAEKRASRRTPGPSLARHRS